MADLFPITLADQITAAEREIAYRKRVYPRWVGEGRMKQEMADRQIALMTSISDTLRCVRQGRLSGQIPEALIRLLPPP